MSEFAQACGSGSIKPTIWQPELTSSGASTYSARE